MDEKAAAERGQHAGQPVLAAGAPLARALGAVVLVHGRGGTADGMLSLAGELTHPGFAFLAPQAADNTWYPLSFLAPIEHNEPYLSAAMEALAALLEHLDEAGIPAERTILLGFSQGACLVLEFAARHAQRYAGVVGLSGGLIGPDNTPRDYHGSLEETPVFLGCSDFDPHIPQERVVESGQILELLGGTVTVRLYPNMGHTVNQEELDHVRSIMAALDPA
ncbi:MAG: phospholipase [Anaerolineae bacterium]|nr:phospholipase [Anaerolineae bacterium]